MSAPRSFDELIAAAGVKANSLEPTLEITADESVIIFANVSRWSEMAGGKVPTESDYVSWSAKCRDGQAEWGGCKLIVKP